jgi:hypothetical protein
MESALAGSDEQEPGGGPTAARLPSSVSGAQLRDEECARMAAFRLGDAAKRIAALAGRAQDPALRKRLLAIHEQLLKQERELLATTR